jgi:hypothetical protein
MVHGTDEHSRPPLLVFAAPIVRRGNTVTGLRALRASAIAAALLEEFLLLSSLAEMGGLLLRGLRLRLGRLCLHRLGLGLLRLRCTWLAGFILAAAPAAAMPLRRPKAIGLGWPRFGLGLCRFCRHACTSWHISFVCICVTGPRLPWLELHPFSTPYVLAGRGIGGELLFSLSGTGKYGVHAASMHVITDPAKL